MDEPLAPEQAHRLILRILVSGRFVCSRHAVVEMSKDELTTLNCVHALRAGVVRPAEYEQGSWRYRVETRHVTVVVAFRSKRELVVVTAWASGSMTLGERIVVKCFTCGTLMKTQRENHRYAECGLKHVTLMGLSVSRCPRCGNHEVSIPRIEALHRLIAGALIDKATRFTGEEIRFLRKSLGWSGIELARHMGVATETVSRWEHDVAPIGPQADRLLRLMVARGRPAISYPTERLASIDPGEARTARLELELRGDSWDRLSA